MSDQPAFAALLRRLRMDIGLTQEGLADAAGVSPRSVSDLERGVNRTARKDTARLLADALGLTGAARVRFEAAAQGRPYGGSGPAGTRGEQTRSVAATTPVLPHDIRAFTGREADLARLVTAVTADRGVVGIYAIDGMAGVGKSAFAVHAAHLLAPRYPDGQIFLQLHAHTAGHRPVDPADALASLLLTTGVPAHGIPVTLAGRAGLWRSHLAGKRMLLLLDDAASHEQVTPLLPGAAGSLVLITSRRHLSALDDAVSICLETPPPAEAVALLARVADRADLDAADPAVAEINRLCGYLPLAIGMLARQLHHHPTWSAGGLAADLAAARDRLELMRAENLSIAAAFDLSYRDLSDQQQRLFRRLGLHPGTDVDVYAAAALDGVTLAEARRGLGELFDHHLVSEPVSGRYRLHDLIREHARALAATDDEAEREAVLNRMTAYYVSAAATVGRPFNRGELETGEPGFPLPQFAGRAEAALWMEAERANMHGIVDMAALRGQPGPGIAIAAAMSGFLLTHGHWTQMRVLHATALEAARQVGYGRGEADVLVSLGIVQRLSGDYAASATTLAEALEICRRIGYRRGQANALVALGVVQRLTVSYPVAADTLAQALEFHTRSGDRLGQADALNELGCIQWLTGERRQALASHQRALELCRDRGDRLGEADSLRLLGRVLQQTNGWEEALSQLTRALDLYRSLGDRVGEAHALNFLGAALHANRDARQARDVLAGALAAYRDLGHQLGQAEVLNNLGDLRLGTDPREARRCYHQALEAALRIGALLEQARALEGLGAGDLRDGRLAEGGTRTREALGAYRRLGSPRADAAEQALRAHEARHPGEVIRPDPQRRPP